MPAADVFSLLPPLLALCYAAIIFLRCHVSCRYATCGFLMLEAQTRAFFVSAFLFAIARRAFFAARLLISPHFSRRFFMPLLDVSLR